MEASNAAAIVLDSDDDDVTVVGEVISGPAAKAARKALRSVKKSKKRRKDASPQPSRHRKVKHAARSAFMLPAVSSASSSSMSAPPAAASLPSMTAAPEPCGFSVLTIPSPTATPNLAHCRVRAAGEVPPAFCTECRRPLDAAGASAAVVEFQRPWLPEPSRVHAELRCLESAGLLNTSAPAMPSPRGSIQTERGAESHGVLRSPLQPVAERSRAMPAVAVRRSRLPTASLAAARQIAAAAAMRALRRAADDAADEAASGRVLRRRLQQRRRQVAQERAERPDPKFEALLAALPPAARAKREDIPKGERCSVCHGKLLRKGRKIRNLPCGHTFHDACILPWLRKSSVCPLDRRDIAELLGVNVAAERCQQGAAWVAEMIQVNAVD
eukprot:gb/GFBE01072186.1/.p1 GENE.gb/GFBE01072186.1/~~gb/GFBE01072186.1/.p1  ORF type:complete len:385 (+),score=63.08 gb/GFBE01072186.1/:1-1155(+)